MKAFILRVRRWLECMRWDHIYVTSWVPVSDRPNEPLEKPVFECSHCGSTFTGASRQLRSGSVPLPPRDGSGVVSVARGQP